MKSIGRILSGLDEWKLEKTTRVCRGSYVFSTSGNGWFGIGDTIIAAVRDWAINGKQNYQDEFGGEDG